MAKRPDVRNGLIPVLPQWTPEPITPCALFSGPSRLTPKVQVLLDFLDEYIGTDRDPGSNRISRKGTSQTEGLPPGQRWRAYPSHYTPSLRPSSPFGTPPAVSRHISDRPSHSPSWHPPGAPTPPAPYCASRINCVAPSTAPGPSRGKSAPGPASDFGPS